jgi:hypothetical protein
VTEQNKMRISIYKNKHSMAPTCFGHSYGHPHGGALKGMDISKYCQILLNRWLHPL